MARTIGIGGGTTVEGIKVAVEHVGDQAVYADFEAVALGLGRDINAAIRAAAQVVVRAIPQFTPYDPEHRTDRKDKLGNLRDSFRATGINATAAGITSSHPAAGVHEYGGTIAPRTNGVTGQGADIAIKPSAMAYKAGQQQAGAYEALVTAAVDRLLRQHGL